MMITLYSPSILCWMIDAGVGDLFFEGDSEPFAFWTSIWDELFLSLGMLDVFGLQSKFTQLFTINIVANDLLKLNG